MKKLGKVEHTEYTISYCSLTIYRIQTCMQVLDVYIEFDAIFITVYILLHFISYVGVDDLHVL